MTASLLALFVTVWLLVLVLVVLLAAAGALGHVDHALGVVL